MPQPQRILCPKCHRENRGAARFCQHCGHDMVLNNAGPRFYLTRVIKAGGQGAVYEGRDDAGMVVAVKEMLDDFTDADERADGIARFEAEAKMLELLAHPRIPRVYAHFADEGKHYLVMDFVRGEDLADVVEREGAIPEQRVLAWAEQICDVLGYLHDNGLIYRDMKPGNVMLETGGTIKLIDFGIAKVLKGKQRGTQIGTPGYAPPEQYQGIATRESDIYALGATLHHLLTGRDPQNEAPFSFPSAHVLNPAVSQRSADALSRALQMRPEDRFGSLDEFCAALGLGAAAPSTVRRAPASVPAPAPRPQPAAPQPAPAPPAPAVPPPASAPSPAPAPSPAAPAPSPVAPRPKTAGVSCLMRLVPMLLLLVLVGAAIFAFAPLLLPSALPPAPTPTAQTLVQQEFRVEAEIIVPGRSSSQQVYEGFVYTYGVLAREHFGQNIQILPDSVAYATGAPAYLGADERGERYRAELVGTVLVPQP